MRQHHQPKPSPSNLSKPSSANLTNNLTPMKVMKIYLFQEKPSLTGSTQIPQPTSYKSNCMKNYLKIVKGNPISRRASNSLTNIWMKKDLKPLMKIRWLSSSTKISKIPPLSTICTGAPSNPKKNQKLKKKKKWVKKKIRKRRKKMNKRKMKRKKSNKRNNRSKNKKRNHKTKKKKNLKKKNS